MAEKMDLSSFVIEESEEQKKPIELVLPAAVMGEILSIRVSAETKKSLEDIAKKYRMSMSEVVRQLAHQGMQLVNRKK